MTTELKTPVLEAHRAREHAKELLAEAEKRHKTEIEQLRRDLDRASEVLSHAQAGTLPRTREVAETVIRVECYEFDQGVIAAACADLANGAKILRERYIGVKNYDRFRHQREDHTYGMKPRHGSIVFRVGLTDEARKRDLTEHEIEAALIYLGNYKAAMPR